MRKVRGVRGLVEVSKRLDEGEQAEDMSVEHCTSTQTPLFVVRSLLTNINTQTTPATKTKHTSNHNKPTAEKEKDNLKT